MTPIIQEISAVSSQIESLKERVDQIIKDKSIPVEERWKLFLTAPEYYFEKTSSILHIGSFEKLGYNIGYEMDIHVDRYQEIDLADKLDDFFYMQEDELTEDQINEIKEEVLEYGFRLMTYDW